MNYHPFRYQYSVKQILNARSNIRNVLYAWLVVLTAMVNSRRSSSDDEMMIDRSPGPGIIPCSGAERDTLILIGGDFNVLP